MIVSEVYIIYVNCESQTSDLGLEGATPSITSNTVEKYLANVRSFPQGKKNYYTIQPSPGKGDWKTAMEKQLKQLEISYPDKARGVAKFNVLLAHIITSVVDFMIVPSRFEPCGLI
ncbi:hypothetical protein AgCh_038012 [Apium graveolens]